MFSVKVMLIMADYEYSPKFLILMVVFDEISTVVFAKARLFYVVLYESVTFYGFCRPNSYCLWLFSTKFLLFIFVFDQSATSYGFYRSKYDCLLFFFGQISNFCFQQYFYCLMLFSVIVLLFIVIFSGQNVTIYCDFRSKGHLMLFSVKVRLSIVVFGESAIKYCCFRSK